MVSARPGFGDSLAQGYVPMPIRRHTSELKYVKQLPAITSSYLEAMLVLGRLESFGVAESLPCSYAGIGFFHQLHSAKSTTSQLMS